MNHIKHQIATMLMPVARWYFQNLPWRYLKSFLWQQLNWREHHYSARTKDDVLMKGRTNDLVQGYIYFFGVWEPNLTHFVRQRMSQNRGRTFIDIGANVGYFSLLAAKVSEGNVVCIEAFPSIYDKLKENIRINDFKKVRPVFCAATETEKEISMYHAGPVNEGSTTSVAGKFATQATIVQGRPLWQILTAAEVNSARLIKIDVEGAEFSVFQGMIPLLGKFPEDVEIVMEITPTALKPEQISDIFRQFSQAGFVAYTIRNTYDPEYYLFPQATSRPERMIDLPPSQTDVVFSRVKSDFL